MKGRRLAAFEVFSVGGTQQVRGCTGEGSNESDRWVREAGSIRPRGCRGVREEGMVSAKQEAVRKKTQASQGIHSEREKEVVVQFQQLRQLKVLTKLLPGSSVVCLLGQNGN